MACGNLLKLDLCPYDMTPFVFGIFLAFWQGDLSSLYTFPAQDLESAISPRVLVPLAGSVTYLLLIYIQFQQTYQLNFLAPDT